MKNENKMQILRDWEIRSKRLSDQLEYFAKLTGALSESPLLDAIWKLFDHHTESVARLIECDAEDLSWYCFDNQFGEKQWPAVVNGVERQICTVEDLGWMLGLDVEQQNG